MTVYLKIPAQLLEDIHQDLSRAHAFAAERVGFLTCGTAASADGGQILLGHRWHAVADDDYVDDPKVGAAIGGSALRKILQYAYATPISILHVHRHDHRGVPHFSPTDMRSAREFVPSFFNVQRSLPHGIMVLSFDGASGQIWEFDRTTPRPINVFQVVGDPLRNWS
jgi:hypothetical protein